MAKSLIDTLNEETEEVKTGGDFAPEPGAPEADTPEGMGDGFDDDGNPVMTGANSDDFDDDEPDPATDLDTEEPPAPAMTAKEAGLSATWYIKAFNLFQKTILKPLYRKRMLQEGDIEKVREASRKAKNKGAKHIQDLYVEGDPMYDVCARFDRYMEAIEDLPLTPAEQKELMEPLAAVIEKYKWMQMGPEGQLLLAVFVIMAPRIEPAMPGLFDKLKQAGNE